LVVLLAKAKFMAPNSIKTIAATNKKPILCTQCSQLD
jgi:hypothetical protein